MKSIHKHTQYILSSFKYVCKCNEYICITLLTNRPWIFVLNKNMTERIFTSLMRCWIVHLGVCCCLRQSGHNKEYQLCLKPEVSKLQNSNYIYLLNFKMLYNVDSRACVCVCDCVCVWYWLYSRTSMAHTVISVYSFSPSWSTGQCGKRNIQEEHEA